MRQSHYLISEMELDRLKALSEAFHFTLFEFIESRRIQAVDEEPEAEEFQKLNSIIEELDTMAMDKNRKK